jgi:hypothetical protein
MNVKWHGRHVLPKRASLEQRLEWHREHQAQCACRPIPLKLLEQMQPSSGKTAAAAGPANRAWTASDAREYGAVAETRFSNIVLAFGDQPSVSYGGKGFGSSALRFSGKIFAMLTSHGQFVVKLTGERVAELVEQNQGLHFDPERGRLLMEWLVVPASSTRWLELAKEAYIAASGRPSRISRPPTPSSASRPLKARVGKAGTSTASAPKLRVRTS